MRRCSDSGRLLPVWSPRGLFQAFADWYNDCGLGGRRNIAASFSGPVTGLVAPLIEEHITQQVDEALGLAPGEMPEADVQEDEAWRDSGLKICWRFWASIRMCGIPLPSRHRKPCGIPGYL